jgi:hypothetical protein
MPGLNASLDRFVRNAIAASLAISTATFPTCAHVFDILDRTIGDGCLHRRQKLSCRGKEMPLAPRCRTPD